MKRDKYDVVVIGAGFGGLSAAALLAHSGYKTIVLEKLPHIGGRCSTYEYHGFQLNTGAVWVLEGVIQSIWGEAGAEFELRSPRPQYLYRIGGRNYEMPEKGGLAAMMGYAAGNGQDAQRIMDAIKKGLTWQEPSGAVTLKEWLLQFTRNRAILGVFQAFVSMSTGLRLSDMPAPEFFALMKEVATLRTYGYAPGGLLSLMESLAKVIKAKGGKVVTRCRARRILVNKNGTVKGVLAEDENGQVEMTAPAVISNAGPKLTVELAGREHFDIGYLRELAQKLKPGPQIVLDVVSDRPLLDSPATLFLTESRRIDAISPSGNVCREYCPSGKYLLECGAFVVPTFPPRNLPEQIEMAIQDLRECLPGFDKYGQVSHVGCYYGDWPLSRSWAGYNFPQKTPIENLYNVGDGSKPAGCWGTHGAGWSARIVVNDIKKRFKPGQAE